MPALTKAQMESIRQLNSKAMRQAVIRSFSDIANEAVLSEIVARLDAGDIDGAIAVVNYNRAQFAAMEAAMIAAYSTGGATVAQQVGRIALDRGTGPQVLFKFDVRAPRAEQWLSDHSSRLIVEIIDDQRAMARNVLRAGLEAGRNPRNVALDLVGRIDRVTGRRSGGFIGLTDQQAGFVMNARRELESGDPAQMARYFTRERRDKRFDGIVRKAIDEGRPVGADDLSKITARYNDRLLQLRGETIARTESLDALRAGQHEAVQQAMEAADVRPNEAKKVWDATGDGRTRDDHLAMEGQERPIGVPFNAPDGSRLQYPGDRSLGAPAEQTINCRCRERQEIDFLGRALRIEGF